MDLNKVSEAYKKIFNVYSYASFVVLTCVKDLPKRTKEISAETKLSMSTTSNTLTKLRDRRIITTVVDESDGKKKHFLSDEKTKEILNSLLGLF